MLFKKIKKHKLNATFKFQFRNLDTFISKKAAESNNFTLIDF